MLPKKSPDGIFPAGKRLWNQQDLLGASTGIMLPFSRENSHGNPWKNTNSRSIHAGTAGNSGKLPTFLLPLEMLAQPHVFPLIHGIFKVGKILRDESAHPSSQTIRPKFLRKIPMKLHGAKGKSSWKSHSGGKSGNKAGITCA